MSGVKGKSGLKPGHTNNPNGKAKGTKNKVTYDVKKKLAEGLTDDFVKSIYTDIEEIENKSEAVKAKLKLLEFFIPKPKAQEDIEQENEFRKEFLERIFPKR